MTQTTQTKTALSKTPSTKPTVDTHLSRRERQIMDALFEGRELSAQDVRAALPKAPSYSAVRAMLAKLVEKNLVTFRADGPRYIYSPVIAQKEARASALERVLKTFFSGSRIAAVNALLGMSKQPLSDQEVDELQAMIDSARKKQL